MFSVVGSPDLPLIIEDRFTSPEEPGNGTGYTDAQVAAAYEFMGLGEQYREEHIGIHAALTVSAIWACVRWISQSIASLAFQVFERDDAGNEPVDLTDNVSWLLGMQPNPEVNAYEFWQVIIKDALTTGNAYAEIERDGFGRIRWLWRIDPGRVDPTRDLAGNLIYPVKNTNGEIEAVLQPENVFHVKNIGEDGIVGWSVISLARRSIEIALAQEKYGQNYFRRGPMPGGVLEVPMSQNVEKRKETKKTFEEAYGGSRKAGGVIVISTGYKFTPLTLMNKDAEWIASRTFSIEEVARWFGVPLHKLAELTHATFSNIEHQSIEGVQDCLFPWCRRLESEADIKLFGSINRGKRFTKIDLDALLRGDSVAQTTAMKEQVNGGLRTVNEARKKLGLNSRSDGDELIVQGAMTTLERVIEGTSQIGNPVPPKQVPPNQPDQGNKNESPKQPDKLAADLSEPFRKLLENCFSDFLRVEADKARRAANKGKLAEHCESFYREENYDDVRKALNPIFAAFLAATKRNSVTPESLVDEAVTRHIAWSKRTLTDAGKVPDDWDTRAGEIALAELKLAWSQSKP